MRYPHAHRAYAITALTAISERACSLTRLTARSQEHYQRALYQTDVSSWCEAAAAAHVQCRAAVLDGVHVFCILVQQSTRSPWMSRRKKKRKTTRLRQKNAVATGRDVPTTPNAKETRLPPSLLSSSVPPVPFSSFTAFHLHMLCVS